MNEVNTAHMNASELQQALFRQIKERLPAHLSLADEIGSRLGVSADSAYRRIRGEKLMDIGELQLLAAAFGISVDALFAQAPGNVVFRGRFVGEEDFNFAAWLTSVNAQLELAAEGGERTTFIFQAKDIPLFHHFQVPELALFKFFFWRRTILRDERFQAERFDLRHTDEELLALGRRTFLTYMRIPSTEIWNAESLNSTLRQIAFYRDSGVFAREEEAQLLFDRLLALLDHLEAQAAAGVKFAMGDSAARGSGAYHVYVNEVMLGDNMIYADNGRQCVVFMNHGVINYLGTTDAHFNATTLRGLQNIMQRSMLISGTGEKERNRFFKAMREEVARRRK